jgi:superfamily I DNA and/or RNA helicase
MNVLLSRAKQQLVLVGSLEFLHEATRYATTSPDDELSFVRIFLEVIASMQKEETLSGVPKVTVVKSSVLRNAV